MLVAHESWYSLEDQKLSIDVAFIDFNKAFNRIPYKRLLSTSSGIGIGGDLIM